MTKEDCTTFTLSQLDLLDIKKEVVLPSDVKERVIAFRN